MINNHSEDVNLYSGKTERKRCLTVFFVLACRGLFSPCEVIMGYRRLRLGGIALKLQNIARLAIERIANGIQG